MNWDTELEQIMHVRTEEARIRQVEINNALRQFEPLSRRKINIFEEYVNLYRTKERVDDWIFSQYEIMQMPWKEFSAKEKVFFKDFRWMAGMSLAHAKKICEICFELEKAGCAYIVEGKLKGRKITRTVMRPRCNENLVDRGTLSDADFEEAKRRCREKVKTTETVTVAGGRPDITVLCEGHSPICNIEFTGRTSDLAEGRGMSSGPFHIEVLESEKELKKHKELDYPFPIVTVRA